jgi:hypothetical protein
MDYPLAEVMDKMPVYGDVVVTSIVLAIAVGAAAAWRPVLAPIAVFIGVHFIPWFEPAIYAISGSYDAAVGDAMRKEDAGYFAFARSIPWMLVGGWLIGGAIWFARRRLRARREVSSSN